MECLQTKLRLDVATNDPRTISDFDSWHVLFFKKRTNPVAYTIECQDIIVNGKSDVFTNHKVLGTEDIDDMTPIYIKGLKEKAIIYNGDYPLLADFSVMHPYGNTAIEEWNNGIPVKATTEEIASYFTSSKKTFKVININGDITGSIEDISVLKNLRYIGLYWTNITGDIGTLSNLIGLENIRLEGTKVTGNIDNVIEKCTMLKEIVVPTSVTISEEKRKILEDRGGSIKFIDFKS